MIMSMSTLRSIKWYWSWHTHLFLLSFSRTSNLIGRIWVLIDGFWGRERSEGSGFDWLYLYPSSSLGVAAVKESERGTESVTVLWVVLREAAVTQWQRWAENSREIERKRAENRGDHDRLLQLLKKLSRSSSEFPYSLRLHVFLRIWVLQNSNWIHVIL